MKKKKEMEMEGSGVKGKEEFLLFILYSPNVRKFRLESLYNSILFGKKWAKGRLSSLCPHHSLKGCIFQEGKTDQTRASAWATGIMQGRWASASCPLPRVSWGPTILPVRRPILQSQDARLIPHPLFSQSPLPFHSSPYFCKDHKESPRPMFGNFFK